jgi:hypothetical protein
MNSREKNSFSFATLQIDTNCPPFVVGKLDASLFKGLLYLNDGGEVSFHNSLVLLDSLKRRQANSGDARKRALAPAQKGPRRPDLRRISHSFRNVSDSISVDNNSEMMYFNSI